MNLDEQFLKKRARLSEKAKEISESPGIYLMKDVGGAILYVGKAKNLRNRVQTYFKAAPHESPRTDLLVTQIEDFELIITETEAEALILECTLIKKHKPRFNVRLKDDKTYPYIKIQVGESYPRLEWTRRVLRDGARYFGPFPSAWSARQVLDLLNQTFKLRDCSDNSFRNRSRPCILYQINKCSAPCVGKVSAEDYRSLIQDAIQVLEGKGHHLVENLEKAMQAAAESEDYETAILFRDQLQHLKIVTELQSVVEPGGFRNRDILGIARSDTDAYAAILLVRGGKLIAVKHISLQNTDSTLPDSELLEQFLDQYYVTLHAQMEKDSSLLWPEQVLIPQKMTEGNMTPALNLLEKTLHLNIAEASTEEDERLVNVAKTNAQHAVEQSKKRAQGHGIEALEEVQQKLQMSKFPARIECYDISNFQGGSSVASRVVFLNGAPDKNLYRRYQIKTVEGQNDFAMMKEVLGRRFSKQQEALPDLLIVDGGKGQLAQATAILEELNVQGVCVAGLAKARTKRDFKSPEVESTSERVFLPGRKNPVALYPTSPAFRLLTHIRDEAHRFAIQYHRLLRDKKSTATDQ